MKLEQLVHRVEAHLVGLGRSLLRASEKADLQEDLHLAEVDLAARKDTLAETVTHRTEVRKRIQENKAAAAGLPAQVEDSFRRGKSSQALRQALELERLRRDIATDEAELPKLDQTIWSLSFQLRQLERRLKSLRRQLARY